MCNITRFYWTIVLRTKRSACNNIIAGNLTGWVAFRLEDVRETEGEKQSRAKNNKDEKEEKRLKREKTHLLGVFCFHGHF